MACGAAGRVPVASPTPPGGPGPGPGRPGPAAARSHAAGPGGAVSEAVGPGADSPAGAKTPPDANADRPRPPARPPASPPPDHVLLDGRSFATGTRVVLFSEPGGFDAYRGATYFNVRRPETGRAGPGPPVAAADLIDRVVLHYDAAGTSGACFRVLQEERGLSCHFLLDLDGTVYQTLDLRERAWHAGTSNSRSVGIEIANVGAYPVRGPNPFGRWYAPGTDGRAVLTLPPGHRVRRPGRAVRPARPGPVTGVIHGRQWVQYDLTDAQYDALIRLVAALCRELPRLPARAPADAAGRVRTTVLPAEERAGFAGVVGHFHLTPEKVDPGPAFDWPRLLRGVRDRLKTE